MPEFIEHNLRFIIFLVIIVVAVGQKILQAINSAKERPGPPPPQIFGPDDLPRRPRQPYTPPPLGRTTPTPPLPGRHLHPLPPPPLPQQVPMVTSAYDTETEIARQRDMEDRLRQIRESLAQPQTTAPPPPTPHRRQRTTGSQGGLLHRRLRDPQEVRRAFVLKEILDRPIALRQ